MCEELKGDTQVVHVEVRVAAGLGDSPNKYGNQRTEAFNNVLKEETGHVKVDQTALHELVKANIVDQQHAELSKALFEIGEYRQAPEYQHLQYPCSVDHNEAKPTTAIQC